MNRLAKISLLLFFFALCGAATVITHQARQRTPAPDARDLYSVVNRQLSAFRSADFASAYRHAAAGVQEKFSRSQFELMIQRDFSSLTKAEHVEFGAVQVAGDGALVQVFLTTPDGATRAYLYSFTAERDGWKIDGVQPLGPQPARHLPGLHI
ncbi:MAG TPA: DUF4864 domain-containing protein [Chthoniobacterales bacterium]|jgi:hypothetical protein|nr:DUF4864 domain-containing protein [Chthoniobacterales bacterium]